MGCTYCQMNDYDKALNNLEDFFKMDTSDKVLLRDLERVRGLQKVFILKKKGDKSLCDGNAHLDIKFYNIAISMDSTLMSAKFNCVTALFLKEDFTSCVKACKEILSILLKSQSRKISPKKQVEFGGIPPQGSKER